MTCKLLRYSIQSLLLILVLATMAPAAYLTLDNIEGEGTVEYSIYYLNEGAWQTIAENESIWVDGSWPVSIKAIPATGYVFSEWTGNIAAAPDADDPYGFTSIAMDTTDQQIAVTFVPEPSPADTTSTVSAVVPGCATSVETSYSSGFDATDFTLFSVSVVDGQLQLDTGNDALDPNSIVIPFEQEVQACFLNEKAGYTSTLGWMLRDNAVVDPSDPNSAFKGWKDIPDDAKHPIFGIVVDDVDSNNQPVDGGDGILDILPDSESSLASYVDPNAEGSFIVDGDGSVTEKDMCKVLGEAKFKAGTELVFWLANDTGDWDKNQGDHIFYTKEDWNPDTFTSCNPESTTRSFRLGDPITANGCEQLDKGLFDATTISRLDSLGLSFRDSSSASPDIKTFDVFYDQRFPHSISVAPQEDPNQWILTWEDLSAGGDMDYNDITFRIKRKSGGSAQLTSPMTPLETGAFYTAVTLEVVDEMPGAGASMISYEISVDGGDNWMPINNWDIVKQHPSDDGTFTVSDIEAIEAADGIGLRDIGSEGDDISGSWDPDAPAPPITYRSVRIDFAALNISGDELLWRASFSSNDEAIQPRILDVKISGSVATNGEISRSTPVIQGNILYNASYETPAIDWTDLSLRGHLRAMRIYDPTNPSQTDYVELWDAATVLQAKEPSTRVIKYPEMTVTPVPTEDRGDGDGSTTTFTGTLDHHPVLATTVQITDGNETFTDSYINDLVGNLSQGVTGSINRETGEYSVTFNTAPGEGVSITASYSYYTLTGNLINFSSNAGDDDLALDDTPINSSVCASGSEPIYDFNGDCTFTSADRDWLINWTLGYVDGGSTKKEGILGAIDHSTPAMVTPPGRPSWYYGTSVTAAERDSFDSYRETYKERRSIVVVGSRNGMLHAFDAGDFRWGDNDQTSDEEKRGYYFWSDDSTVTDWWDTFFTNLGVTIDDYSFGWRGPSGNFSIAPDYGTGEEKWAFIPANLMPRLKNNLLDAEDRAYVDASPAVADVFIDADGNGTDEWRTVVLAAEGNGGDTIFCLDVTDTTDPQLLWEFGDPQLFRSRSSPAIAAIGRIYDVTAAGAKWVAFFVSGRNYDTTAFPAIYMVDIETGTVLQKILLDTIDSGKGGVPSGQPAVVDSDGNGYIDRAYIGTDKGYLYKINLPDSPTTAGTMNTAILVNTDFSDEDGNTVAAAQQYHPIYGSPSVVVDNGIASDGSIDYNVRIFFGTGDSPYYDEDIDTGNTSYHFFAYNDKGAKGSTLDSDIHLVWFYELPAGQRIFTSAFAAAGQVYFGTASGETEDPCEGPNEGRLYAFTYDGASLITDALGNEGMEVGDQYTSPIVEDEHLYIKANGKIKSFGDGIYNNDVKKGGLPSTQTTFWREIF